MPDKKHKAGGLFEPVTKIPAGPVSNSGEEGNEGKK
jgi:hypothetical protein